MEKEALRNGLKRLEQYMNRLDFKSLFLEEGPAAAMDSLVFAMQIGDELSYDLTCNYVHVPQFGELLQFYGQLNLEQLLKENPNAFSQTDILQMINRLNQEIPIGHLLYLQGEENGQAQQVIGIRYTMLTGLDREEELQKCAGILTMLMNIYEVLCSTLVLLLNGESLETAIQTIAELLDETMA